MIGIETSKLFFVPENNAEANGEILGRCNVLHDYIKSLAIDHMGKDYYTQLLDSDMRMVCTIMGFTDLLAMKKPEKKEEPVLGTPTDPIHEES